MNAGKSEKEPAKASEKKTESKGAAQTGSGFRGRIYNNILDTIGATPVVRLPRIIQKHNVQADLVAKLEFFNPMASVKDRAALATLEQAEKAGKITPGKITLIEASVGNSAHSLAFIAAVKGYKIILVMPETAPPERRRMLLLLGATLVLTPGDHGMKGAIERAKEIITENKGKEEMYFVNLVEDAVAARFHAETTAEEIWNDTGGKIDIFVAGVGSGATITGVAHALKKKKESLKVYAVEPSESAVLSGEKKQNLVQHKIHGIGIGYMPPVLDTKAIDGVIKIDSDKAIEMARDLVKTEGIAGGISSGAALAAALNVAAISENKGKMIVFMVSSFSERYLSTPLFVEKQ